MNEERKAAKAKHPPIGSSIPAQYQSFGSSNGNEDTDEEEIKRPAAQRSKSPTVQTLHHPDVETFSSPAVQTSSSPNMRKSKHPDWKQKTAYLPPELEQWLNVQAAIERREISEIVTEALETYRQSH